MPTAKRTAEHSPPQDDRRSLCIDDSPADRFKVSPAGQTSFESKLCEGNSAGVSFRSAPGVGRRPGSTGNEAMKPTIVYAGLWWLWLAAPVIGGQPVAGSPSPMAAPGHFQALSRQLRVDLVWDAAGPGATYEVQRARNASGPFEALPARLPGVNAYSDFIGQPGGEYYYRVRTIRSAGTNAATAPSAWSAVRAGSPNPLDPGGLLTEVQEAGFRYFFDFAHPVSGLARVGTSKDGDVCSIATM